MADLCRTGGPRSVIASSTATRVGSAMSMPMISQVRGRRVVQLEQQAPHLLDALWVEAAAGRTRRAAESGAVVQEKGHR
jgi:hypothetical protein